MKSECLLKHSIHVMIQVHNELLLSGCQSHSWEVEDRPGDIVFQTWLGRYSSTSLLAGVKVGCGCIHMCQVAGNTV